MNVVEFKGYKCIEEPITDWERWTCKHLMPYVSDPCTDKGSSIRRILRDGSRSAEIFLIVKGPLPPLNEPEGSPVSGNADVVTCNSCWINIYDSAKL